MKVSPEVGRQLYSDIQEQERLFQDPEYRSLQINSPNNPAYMKENILRGIHLFIMAACLIHLHLIAQLPLIKENVGS